MRTDPPANLVRLLVRLQLATAEQVAGVARRAGRLAGELPDFESVWVDALAQGRVITPFQAAEINAGRGDELRWGPYVVTGKLAGPHWAECFAARHAETRRPVRLYVTRRPQGPLEKTVAALAELLAKSQPLGERGYAVVEDIGTRGQAAWAVCGSVEGTTAADWMVENGRFPPAAVLHMAREMVARLADLEMLGIVHGDVSAAGLVLEKSGQVALPAAGLRGIVRPEEGYSFVELHPAAYDYLAPERIAEGSAPSVAGDAYACGGVWWHLLTGRAPFAGGDSLSKLKAVHAARRIDVRSLAPDVPEVLAAAIDRCLSRPAESRPRSFAELAEVLGSPTRGGTALVANLLWRPAQPWQAVRLARRQRQTARRVPWVATAAVAVVLAALWVPLALRMRETPANDGGEVAATKAPATEVAAARAVETPAAADAVASKQAAAEQPAKMPIDRAVRPAVALLPVEAEMVDDVVLPVGEIAHVELLDLEAHARVRGRAGGRAMVAVPRRGLMVAREDVTFENVDFIWEEEPAGGRAALGGGAMIVLRAQTASFRGCTFTSAGDGVPAAIAWTGAADQVSRLGGELVFRDCVFDGLAAVVDCQFQGGAAVTMNNALCVASGPLVRMRQTGETSPEFALSLERVTTRGDSAVLECHCESMPGSAVSITITANDSVLASSPRTGLLVLNGRGRPEALLAALEWRGRGSLVTPHTPLAIWRSGRGGGQALAEDELQVAGLVRSEVQFAGSADRGPAASRVTHWQAPLLSADPPGAKIDALPVASALSGAVNEPF